MNRSDSAPSPTAKVTAWALLACTLLFAGLHFCQLPRYAARPLNSYLGSLLPTTPDAFYYLRQAADVSMGLYSPNDYARTQQRPATPPLPSLLAAKVHAVLGAPLMDVAFFIPPVLAFGLVLASWLVGSAIGRPVMGMVAGLVASSSYLWYTRVFMGAFDTDCLILPLFVTALGCMYKADGARLLSFAAWGAACLTALALLGVWWGQGGTALAAVALGVYASSVVFPGPRPQRWAKAAMLAAGIGFLAYLLLGSPQGTLAVLSDTLKEHLELVFKAQPSPFAETGNTVAELSSVTPVELATDTSGHWLLFIVAACGFAAIAQRHPRLGFMVGLPCLGLGTAALWAGNRFAMFMAPVHGLGLAWLTFEMLQPLLARRGFRRPLLAAGAACLILAAPSAARCVTATILPAHDYNAVKMASEINHKAPEDAFVWNWWGPGYMQEYFTRRTCLIDGGLQQPQNVYVASVPFAASNPLLARNWIKFFSVHTSGIDVVAPVAGGKDKAAAFLKDALGHPDRLDEVLAGHHIPADRDWRAFLFPQRDVYLILHAEMLLRSTWNSLGRWDPLAGKGPDVEVYLFPLESVRVNRQEGFIMNAAGERMAYSRLYFITPTSLSHDHPRDDGPVALRVEGLPFIYSLEQEYFNCLAYQLLFVHPETTPGFEALVYNPFIGGVWKVL